MIDEGKQSEGREGCREEKGFSFVLLKFELIVARPRSYVIYLRLQVTCKTLYVVWWS